MAHAHAHRSLTRRPSEDIRKDARGRVAAIFEELANKVEPGLAKVIRDAIEAQSGKVSLQAIQAALEAGDVGKVLAMLDLPAALAPLETITPALQKAIYAAGTVAAGQINLQLKGVEFVFNQLNPRLITWLQTYSLGLIQQINESTKAGVRLALQSGISAGKNPKSVAVAVKSVIGLTERQAQAVLNFRKELETFHMKQTAGGWNLGGKINRIHGTQVWVVGDNGQPTDGILDRRLRDFRFDSTLKNAMQTGKPLTDKQIDTMVAAYRRKYLAYRSRTIARTEAIRANNVGIQDAWQQAMEKGLVNGSLTRKQWLLSRDERTCEDCAPVPTMNPKLGVQIGQPFNTPIGPQHLPPLHPNCRCGVLPAIRTRTTVEGMTMSIETRIRKLADRVEAVAKAITHYPPGTPGGKGGQFAPSNTGGGTGRPSRRAASGNTVNVHGKEVSLDKVVPRYPDYALFNTPQGPAEVFQNKASHKVSPSMYNFKRENSMAKQFKTSAELFNHMKKENALEYVMTGSWD